MPKVYGKSVIVREMKQEEKDVVRQLLIDSYVQYKKHFDKDRWEKYFIEVTTAVDNEQIDRLFIATYKAEIVGTMQVFQSSNEAYDIQELQINDPIIRFLAVHPNGRGLGIAQLLLDYAVAYSREKKANAIYLHTTDIMSEAVNLYVRYGFIREETYDYLKSGNLIKCYKFNVEG